MHIALFSGFMAASKLINAACKADNIEKLIYVYMQFHPIFLMQYILNRWVE